jgi:hypothetical protein
MAVTGVVSSNAVPVPNCPFSPRPNSTALPLIHAQKSQPEKCVICIAQCRTVTDWAACVPAH